jgi:hypothetical protein
MKKDKKTNPSPEALAEMRKAIAQFNGPIRKIPLGKRTRRGPSKKIGQSGARWEVNYTPAAFDNEVYGSFGGGDEH